MKDFILRVVQSKKLPFKFLFKFISRYECVQDYWDGHYSGYKWDDDKANASRGHINASCLMAFISILFLFIHPLFIHLYVALFLYHSPLTELWDQYDGKDWIGGLEHRNKVAPLWWLMAQMIERGIGFAFFLPFLIAAYIPIKLFEFHLI